VPTMGAVTGVDLSPVASMQSRSTRYRGEDGTQFDLSPLWLAVPTWTNILLIPLPSSSSSSSASASSTSISKTYGPSTNTASDLDRVSAVLFSNDGRWLVSDDEATDTLLLWKVSTNGLEETPHVLQSVGFVGPGQNFAVWSEDSKLLLVENFSLGGTNIFVISDETYFLQEPIYLPGPSDIDSAGIHPDGTSAVVFSRMEGTVRWRQLSLGQQIVRTCTVAGRALTNAEYVSVVSRNSTELACACFTSTGRDAR